MDRRKFFKVLGIGTAAAVVAPQVFAKPKFEWAIPCKPEGSLQIATIKEISKLKSNVIGQFEIEQQRAINRFLAQQEQMMMFGNRYVAGCDIAKGKDSSAISIINIADKKIIFYPRKYADGIWSDKIVKSAT